MKTKLMPLFAPCPKGLEYLLRDELIEIGAKDAREVLAGVSFSGDMTLAMRACMHSRLASRILLVLCRFAAEDANAVYEAAKELDWPNWLGPERSFVVDVSGSAPGIAHTGFAALRVKDAIIDQHRLSVPHDGIAAVALNAHRSPMTGNRDGREVVRIL